MERQKAKEIIGKLDITPEVKRRVEGLLGESTAVELSAKEATEVKELLQLEMELLEIKEKILSELVAAADKLFESVSGALDTGADLDKLLQESQKRIDERIKEFEGRSDADIAALAAKVEGE